MFISGVMMADTAVQPDGSPRKSGSVADAQWRYRSGQLLLGPEEMVRRPTRQLARWTAEPTRDARGLTRTQVLVRLEVCPLETRLPVLPLEGVIGREARVNRVSGELCDGRAWLGRKSGAAWSASATAMKRQQ